MYSRLSDHYLHLGDKLFCFVFPNKWQVLAMSQASRLAKAVMHPCLPELSREHFLIRFDSQQHRPRAQAFSPLMIRYLTKPVLSPPLSHTDISPVVRIGPRAVEQCHKWSSAPTNGVEGQRNPIHRGEHEEGEGKDECLVVPLPYTAVNPPKGKRRLLCLKGKEIVFSFFLPPPAVRDPNFQGASIQYQLRTLKHVQRSFIAFYRKVIGTSQETSRVTAVDRLSEAFNKCSNLR